MAGKPIAWNELPAEYLRPGDDQRPTVEKIECRMCHHYYAKQRPRCPACGTVATQATAITQSGKVRTAREKTPKIKKEKTYREGDCVFCLRRKPKVTCPICQKPLHRTCASLHIRTAHPQ